MLALGNVIRTRDKYLLRAALVVVQGRAQRNEGTPRMYMCTMLYTSCVMYILLLLLLLYIPTCNAVVAFIKTTSCNPEYVLGESSSFL